MFSRAASGIAIGCLTLATLALAAFEPPSPAPAGLAVQTRGAWIELYASWMEVPGGDAMPVFPGPAFCVGHDGFVVADQDVVANALHLFATIDGHGPFAARARAFDADSGIALVQLSPAALEGTRCLERAGDDVPPLAAGDTLYAIPPAGGDPVPLRVRKVTAAAVEFDFGLRGPFLAASPLVDAGGRLRGVLAAGKNSAKIGNERATGALTGLAKRRYATEAVPLSAALGLIASVRAQVADGMPVPPPEPVVRVSRGVLTRSLRQVDGMTPEDLSLYHAGAGEVGVELLTPASLGLMLRGGHHDYIPGRSFFRWMAHAQMWEPMVVVQQTPRFEWTSGAKAAAFFTVLFAVPVALSGNDPTFTASYTFPKSDAAIAIERGAERIAPYDSFVDCFTDFIAVEKDPGHLVQRKIRGCRTFYLFPPEAFAPGAEVSVVLTGPGDSRTNVPVRPETQTRIAADFAPWREEVAEGGTEASTPDGVVVSRPGPGVPYRTTSSGRPELRVDDPPGCTFVVVLDRRDGAPVVRVPATWVTGWPMPPTIEGTLTIGRDTVWFDPVQASQTDYARSIPRSGLSAKRSGTSLLRLKGPHVKLRLQPAVSLTNPMGLGEVLGALQHAPGRAVDFTLRLFGDFDLVVRAFDDPSLLPGASKPPPAPPSEPFE